MAKLTIKDVRERRKQAHEKFWLGVRHAVNERIAEINKMLDYMERADIVPIGAYRPSSIDVAAAVAVSMGISRDYFDGPSWFDNDARKYRQDLTDNGVHFGWTTEGGAS